MKTTATSSTTPATDLVWAKRIAEDAPRDHERRERLRHLGESRHRRAGPREAREVEERGVMAATTSNPAICLSVDGVVSTSHRRRSARWPWAPASANVATVPMR